MGKRKEERRGERGRINGRSLFLSFSFCEWQRKEKGESGRRWQQTPTLLPCMQQGKEGEEEGKKSVKETEAIESLAVFKVLC